MKIVKTNPLPFVVGLALLLFVIGMFMYKTQKNQRVRDIHEQPRRYIDYSKNTDNNWFNEAKFKNIRIVNKEPSLHDMERQVFSKQEAELKKQEMEDQYAAKLEIQKMKDKNVIEEKKMEMEAIKSPLNIEVPGPPGSKVAAKDRKPGIEVISDSLDQISAMVKSASASEKVSALSGLGEQLVNDLNHQSAKQVFLEKTAGSNSDYLETAKQRSRSRFEVKAGSNIPAALITGINSDLPGAVNAQVTENVYDSVTGNYLLIPQGTKLIGEYNADLSFGQQRVQVVWNRMIFPDGKNLDLQKMQGTDISGYTGFHDRVDNHYFRIYGNAILLSLMGAGYDILNQNTQQGQPFETPREIVSSHVGQKLADVSEHTLERNMDIQPTLMIRPGYKFKVMVIKDMVLEKLDDDAAGTLSYSG